MWLQGLQPRFGRRGTDPIDPILAQYGISLISIITRPVTGGLGPRPGSRTAREGGQEGATKVL
eukprot:4688540-Karenia_brevis.AAC.1